MAAPAKVAVGGGTAPASQVKAAVSAALKSQPAPAPKTTTSGGKPPAIPDDTSAKLSAIEAQLAAMQLATAQSKAEANQSAKAQINSTLASYGFTGTDLTGLEAFAWTQITAGVDPTQIALNLQSQPAFIAKFPAISARIKAGLPPITPAEYISTLDSYTQTLNAAGISPSSVDLNALVTKDVSPTELSDRIQQGYVAIAKAPQDVISAMQNYYGVTKGQLVQYFTNPKANEATLLQQAAAAQIGGAATGSGFMGKNAQSTTPAISQSLALQLAQQGVTYQQAQSGFGTLATQAQLYNPLPGQGQVRGKGGAPYTANQLAEAQFFGGPAEQALQLQAQQEQAYFKQGTQLGASGQTTAAGPYQR